MANEALLESALTRLNWEEFNQGQLDAFEYWGEDRQRLCVYHPTGNGKTAVMLVCLFLRKLKEALIVAPPSTHVKWQQDAMKLGLKVTTISHAKFRSKSFKIGRHTPLLIDEFHLLGGHKGQGWVKLSRAARGLLAPLLFASATPNYNDAERVYCVDHVLHPAETKGGFISWLHTHCYTRLNPFGATPLVEGFRNHKDAEAFLASLEGVVYVPDTAPDISTSVKVDVPLPEEFYTLHLDKERERIMASQMEIRHRERDLQVDNVIPSIAEILQDLGVTLGAEPTLVYFNKSTLATKYYKYLIEAHPDLKTELVTGKDSAKEKDRKISMFRGKQCDILIGTATLATGTDGIDKVCDLLVIVDNTSDDSLRRQLLGRILPRGVDQSSLHRKRALIFAYNSI